MLCGACRRRGPFCEVDAEVSRSDTRAAIIVAMAAARDAAIAAAIAGWNANPEADALHQSVGALRAALVQARDMLRDYAPTHMGWYVEAYTCPLCETAHVVTWEAGCQHFRHADGHPGCPHTQLLAAIDAALHQSVGALEVTPCPRD